MDPCAAGHTTRAQIRSLSTARPSRSRRLLRIYKWPIGPKCAVGKRRARGLSRSLNVKGKDEPARRGRCTVPPGDRAPPTGDCVCLHTHTHAVARLIDLRARRGDWPRVAAERKRRAPSQREPPAIDAWQIARTFISVNCRRRGSRLSLLQLRRASLHETGLFRENLFVCAPDLGGSSGD